MRREMPEKVTCRFHYFQLMRVQVPEFGKMGQRLAKSEFWQKHANARKLGNLKKLN